MKKHFLKSFALIAMLFSAISINAGSAWCNRVIGHLDPNGVGDKDDKSYVRLTVQDNQDGTISFIVAADPTLPKAAPDVDYVLINPGIGTAGDDATALESQTVKYSVPAGTEKITVEILWSYSNWGGRYMVQNLEIPLSEICGTSDSGEGGEDPVEPTPDPEPEPGAIDWSSIVWLGNGSGLPENTDKYKISQNCLREVVNIQKPGWADEPGIYVVAPGAIESCSVNGAIQGGGMVLYLSSFTAKETEVTINYAGGSCTFWVYYADGTASETPGEGGGDDLIVTEYCDYTDANLTKKGAAIALTWETVDNGDVVITMSNGVGAESCAFRNGGFEGGIDAFVVSTDNFVTTTPASDYFTFTKVYEGNEARLVKIADLQKGAKIKHVGAGHALAWTVNGNGEYCFPDFIYTYGGVCNKFDAPINVAVTEAGVITFDEVIGANAYEVRVYQGAMLKYTQEIVNGGTINFVAYVDGEYLVKVVAKGEGKGDSSESDPVSWNVKASPLPISNYCEAPADRITENQGSCNPLFSWITDATGNVVITISASEGDENATMFRNNAMGGDFLLDGSKDNFIAYFDRVKTDDYTYTLTLKDAANKPLPGAVISYSGQIEAKSSIHVNDWSKYVFDAYLYGTNCTVEDTEKPVMGTATLVSNSYDIAIVEVTATDDMEVAKYRVVDESNDYDKSFKPADGKITVTHLTPSTKYTLTITALDFADNESENSATVEVTTEAHNYKPLAAPTVPTVETKKVIAVYSDVYPCSFSAMEGWGQTTQFEELNFDGDHVRYYTNFNYLGWAAATPINALNMEKLHLDIWAENTGSLKVTPIYGGAGLQTDDQKGLVVELQGQQWNAIELDLTEFVGLDWSSIFQFKFDTPVGGNVFAIDNVYFYRETEIADTEAPTDVVATLKSTSYTSVVITCQAADNSGTVSFDIFDGETKVATNGAESGKPVDVTVAGLEAGKTYNLSVVAYDINENKAAAVTVEAATLALPAPAPAPTHAAENVYSIYSNAYTSPVYFIIGGWEQATVATEVNLAAEDKAYLLQNTNYLGWEINNNQLFDVSAYNKFHIDIYALAEGSLQITPISAGPKEKLQTLTLKEGWNQIDMDCATFEGVEFDKVIQIKFAEGGNATYFIDNVYFHKVAPTDPTGVENNMLDNRSMKVIENGKLIIIRNGVKFDVTGRVVR